MEQSCHVLMCWISLLHSCFFKSHSRSKHVVLNSPTQLQVHCLVEQIRNLWHPQLIFFMNSVRLIQRMLWHLKNQNVSLKVLEGAWMRSMCLTRERVFRVTSLLCHRTNLDRLPSLDHLPYHHKVLLLIYLNLFNQILNPFISSLVTQPDITWDYSEFWRSRCSAKKGQQCWCIEVTPYLFFASYSNQTQQALQNKHPSILRDSQPFWVTARVKTTLTLTGSAAATWTVQSNSKAVIDCLSNVMNRVHSGQGMTESIIYFIGWYDSYFPIHKAHLAETLVYMVIFFCPV